MVLQSLHSAALKTHLEAVKTALDKEDACRTELGPAPRGVWDAGSRACDITNNLQDVSAELRQVNSDLTAAIAVMATATATVSKLQKRVDGMASYLAHANKLRTVTDAARHRFISEIERIMA